MQQLDRMTPTVSLHFPWDLVDDFTALKAHGNVLGLGFDAVNSNTFRLCQCGSAMGQILLAR